MKYLISIVTLITLFLFTEWSLAQDSLKVQNKEKQQNRNQVKTAVQVQTKAHEGQGFVDENGDGYNDKIKDADGDGIPNGQDEDYDGAKIRAGENAKGFVDEDGDGINDNAQNPKTNRNQNRKKVKTMGESEKGSGKGTSAGEKNINKAQQGKK